MVISGHLFFEYNIKKLHIFQNIPFKTKGHPENYRMTFVFYWVETKQALSLRNDQKINLCIRPSS
jgi:hypothetical protein